MLVYAQEVKARFEYEASPTVGYTVDCLQKVKIKSQI